MVSELEITVREMDDASKSIADVAEEIAPLIDLSLHTIRNIISAERNGYESVKDSREDWARRKKFNNYSQYTSFRREQSKKVTYFKVKAGQKKFEDSLKLTEPELLDKMIYSDRSEARATEEESKEELKKYLRANPVLLTGGKRGANPPQSRYRTVGKPAQE